MRKIENNIKIISNYINTPQTWILQSYIRLK
jgi:hypothetical protein